jgi:AcrR family transcriptional regulator
MNRQVCIVKSMPTTRTEKGDRTARDRLLAAADELFYAEGIHTVGIDRVIERAGVAKASLYGSFGSKDELVRAYLQGRAEEREARIEARIERYDDPREKILGIFELLSERVREPTFRGCAFLNATAEGPRGDPKTHDIAIRTRAWMRELFTRLAGELAIDDPPRVARCLQILYDGAVTAASMERDGEVVDEARDLAESLLDAHAPRRTAKRARR